MAGSKVNEKKLQELDYRLLGLEFALEQSVPQLVGALVLHLASKGVINLAEFETALRSDIDPDLSSEDSTGNLFSVLANLTNCYRRDGTGTARYSEVFELVRDA